MKRPLQAVIVTLVLLNGCQIGGRKWHMQSINPYARGDYRNTEEDEDWLGGFFSGVLSALFSSDD